MDKGGMMEDSMRISRIDALKNSWCVVVLTSLLFFSCSSQNTDLYLGGKIVTMDEANPISEAFTVVGGKFTDVGKSDDLRTKYPHARIIQLDCRTVMPGIIESHGHLLDLGKSFLILNVEGLRSPEEVIDRIAERVLQTPAGEWILGWGWDDGAWADAYPSRYDLDRVASENPVVLRGLHGFATWANSSAFIQAGITRSSPSPPNGSIVRNPDGDLQGILTNEAQTLLEDRIPPLTNKQVKHALELAIDECIQHGLTTIHEAKTTKRMLTALRKLRNNGQLKVRIYTMLDVNDKEWVNEWIENGIQIDDWLTIRSIKVFVDGALGSRGAALMEPYSDAPGTRGVVVNDEEALYRWSVKAVRSGFQVVTHAIGDRANRITLNAYQRALRGYPKKSDHRFRVEHAQIVLPEDVPKFAQLGLVVSMQPSHCTSDMPWVEDRIGPQRVRYAYAWRSFLRTNVHLTFNSDFPGETLNPFVGMYAAETRRTATGTPSEGWFPAQCLTRQEVLQAYIRESAYSEFSETYKGMIREGMLADFVVLSDDITSIQPEELLDMVVERTFVGGRCVYDRESSRR